MARTGPSSPGVQRLTSLAATALVAAATAFAFGRVYEGKAATFQLLAVGVGSALLAWSLERRGLLVATLASGAALLVVLGLVVFRETTWFGVPTLETLRQMGNAAGAVSEQARLQSAPTPPIDPLVLAGVVATWASVFSCHALAFRAGSPLLALVPPVALLAFADTVLEDLVRPAYGVAFLVGALGIAFADSLRRTRSWGPVWSARPGRGASVVGASGRGARKLAFAALVVAAIAPIAMPGFGSTGLIDVSSVNDGGRVHVDPLVSIAGQLTRDEEVEVLLVDTPEPTYLRMLTLDAFNGVTWRRTAGESQGRLISNSLYAHRPGAEELTQTITVTTDLGFPWLPMAAEPTHIGISGPLRWDPTSATITLDEPLDEGSRYTTTSDVVEPGAAELRGARPGLDVGDVGPYLEYPTDLPGEIETIARQWTAGIASPYERVLAIQDEFRSFTYSTNVDFRDDSSTLVDFLTRTRTGFCQQFASAMALMLRTIGIPARVAVGFTEGEPDPDLSRLRLLTTDNLHSWVEVPFEGYGWLAFEPTPGRDNPTALRYQDPSAGVICAGRACGTILRRGNENAAGPAAGLPRRRPEFGGPDVAAPPVGGGSRATASLRAMLFTGFAIAALLALVAIPLVRWWWRRRRLHRARGEPKRMVLATYQVLAQRAADLGVGPAPGETPREYLRRLEASDRLGDGHLARLTALATRAAYAPGPLGPDDALDAEADAREVLRSLRRTTPPLRRLAGAYRRG